jgi:hypothetical protein
MINWPVLRGSSGCNSSCGQALTTLNHHDCCLQGFVNSPCCCQQGGLVYSSVRSTAGSTGSCAVQPHAAVLRQPTLLLLLVLLSGMMH